MQCCIRGEAELKGTFHFSLNENFVPLHLMRNIHYLFYITCTKIQFSSKNLKEKTTLDQVKHTSRASNSTRTLASC